MSEQKKLVPTLKYTILAILASTVFVAVLLFILDKTDAHIISVQFGDSDLTIVDSDLTIAEALFAGLVLSMLPIFLFVVLSFTGLVLVLGLAIAIVTVAVVLAIPAGIMALPFLLIVGLVWLLRRGK